MILRDDFFVIAALEKSEGVVLATLDIDPAHRIFAGHFPGQPVVPGVCMMQMIKETLETAIGRATRLQKADHAKFLSMINPLEINRVQAELSFNPDPEGRLDLTARIFTGTTVFLKYRATLCVL